MAATGDVTPLAPRTGFNTRRPTTPAGRWSLWLGVAFVAMVAINLAVFAPRGTSTDPGWNEFSRTYLPYWGLTLVAIGLAAGGTGLWAVLKQQERSLITLLTIVPGLMMLVFLLGEFLIPH